MAGQLAAISVSRHHNVGEQKVHFRFAIENFKRARCLIRLQHPISKLAEISTAYARTMASSSTTRTVSLFDDRGVPRETLCSGCVSVPTKLGKIDLHGGALADLAINLHMPF